MSADDKKHEKLFINREKYYTLTRPLVRSVYQNINFLFFNQNICCGYSKYTLKLMGKKIFTFLRSKKFVYLNLCFTALTSIKGYVWNNSRKMVLS